MNLNEFLLNDEKEIWVENESVSNNPNMISFSMPEPDHWFVTLWRGEDWIQFYFSKGPAHDGAEPTLEEVLECLASDATMYENSLHFDDWMIDLGLNTDSIKEREKHWKTFQLLGDQAHRLRWLLGNERYEQLLWEVEFDQTKEDQAMKQDTLQKRINDPYWPRLTVGEKDDLVRILGHKCPGSTKDELLHKLDMISMFKTAGIFERVKLHGDSAEYVAGQSYPDEIRTLRHLVLSMGHRTSRR